MNKTRLFNSLRNMSKPPKIFRDRLAKVIGETEQLIRDIVWWNNNRLDAEPIDCEIERLAVATGKKALAAFDREDWDEYTRLQTEMKELLEKAATEDLSQ